MATVNDLLEESLRLLLGSQTEAENVLTNDVSDADTTITLQYGVEHIAPGSTLSIGVETMRVWAIDSATGVATVRRGYRGTVPTEHLAGDLVTINPKYSKASLFKALEQDVRDLSSPANGLYRVSALDLVYEPVQVGYELPIIYEFIDVYRIHNLMIGPGDNWTPISGWTLARNQDTTTGSGLRLDIPYGQIGQTMRVSYKHGFSWDSSITLEDDVEDVTGVPSNMQDILTLGILMRVGPVKEIMRNQPEAQGSSRRSEEVPPGSITRSYSVVSAQRKERIRAEALRLSREYGDFSQ